MVLSFPSVCKVGSTREPLHGFGLNLMWRLCYSGLPQNRLFEYPTSGDNKLTDTESREVDIYVLRSGGQSG